MTNYSKGADAEREAIRLLEMLGYDCIRSAGSKGMWDIVAIHLTHVRLIQVKADTTINMVEREAIELYNAPAFATREVWTRISGKPLDQRWTVEVI